jgi:hypothetical protein
MEGVCEDRREGRHGVGFLLPPESRSTGISAKPFVASTAEQFTALFTAARHSRTFGFWRA